MSTFSTTIGSEKEPIKYDKFSTASSVNSGANEEGGGDSDSFSDFMHFVKSPSSHEPTSNNDAMDERMRSSSIFSQRDGHLLEFDNIVLSTKSKNENKHPPLHILKGISSRFPPKTLTAIMGASGSGKTSLLKVLTGRQGRNSI